MHLENKEHPREFVLMKYQTLVGYTQRHVWRLERVITHMVEKKGFDEAIVLIKNKSKSNRKLEQHTLTLTF